MNSTKQLRGIVLVTLALLLLTNPALLAQTTVYFPQIAINEGSQTSFWIHNPDPAEAISVSISLFSPSGGVLSNRGKDLAPGGTSSWVFGEANAELTAGWARLVSNSPFDVTEFFDLVISGVETPRVGVLPVTPIQEGRFFGFVDQRFNSGVAFSNSSFVLSTDVTISLKNRQGMSPMQPVTVTLDPGEQTSAFLDQAALFGPALKFFEGTVLISASPVPVAVTSLVQDRQNGDLSAVSVTPTATGSPATQNRSSTSDEVTLAPNDSFEHSTACEPGEVLLGGWADLAQPGGGTPGIEVREQGPSYSVVGVGEAGIQSWRVVVTNFFSFDRRAQVTVHSVCLSP